MTRKLYDENAYMTQFSATVLSYMPAGNGYAVVLDQTAFFPEGGGQAADCGTLAGQSVLDVQLKDGVVYHYVKNPLAVGESVEGLVDWPTRLSRMRQHTGEHILSGVVHELTGYDNVGFHMGTDGITVDFSGVLTEEQLGAAVETANRIVMENRPVRAWYPTEDELKTLSYRSKKEITEAVRLVEIQGADLCACCAPHLSTTGQVGAIVVVQTEKIHGGSRILFRCGQEAQAYIAQILTGNKNISVLLSAKPTQTCAAVERMNQEVSALKFRESVALKEWYHTLAELHSGKGDVLLFPPCGDVGKIVMAVAETCGGKCAVFLSKDNGFIYAIAEKGGDLRPISKELHAVFGGKGGGRIELVQGYISTSKKSIEEFWEKHV